MADAAELRRFLDRHRRLLVLTGAGCSAPPPPFAQLSGLIVAPQLDELSGLAASRVHDDTLWVLNDGGNPPALYAIGNRGGLQATFRIAGVANTDWEDLAAFDLGGRHYLLIADTGDNGGIRKTLLLHVIEEPTTLRDGGSVKPAWSVEFRWPGMIGVAIPLTPAQRLAADEAVRATFESLNGNPDKNAVNQAVLDFIQFSLLFCSFFTVLGVIKLRITHPDLPRPYRTWGYPVVPVIFLLVAGWLIVSTLITTPKQSFAGVALIILGLPVYYYLNNKSGGVSAED